MDEADACVGRPQDDGRCARHDLRPARELGRLRRRALAALQATVRPVGLRKAQRRKCSVLMVLKNIPEIDVKRKHT